VCVVYTVNVLLFKPYNASKCVWRPDSAWTNWKLTAISQFPRSGTGKEGREATGREGVEGEERREDRSLNRQLRNPEILPIVCMTVASL